MIIQALTNYYNTLAADPQSEIARLGYSAEKLNFALDLSAEGALLEVIPLFTQVERGKTMVDVPRTMIVPARVKRTGLSIAANFLWDNSAYVLGVPDAKGKQAYYGADRFAGFRRLHHEILDAIDDPVARAVLYFLDKHDPTSVTDTPAFAPHLEKMLESGNITFLFRGNFVFDHPKIREAWEKTYLGNSAEAKKMQCLVTGEFAPIARVHPSIKGVRGAKSTGASLVSFNKRAYESFEKKQGYNAPVSVNAAFAYTTALNHLLSEANPNKKFFLGDTTVVYWSESQHKGFEEEVFARCVDPSEKSGGDDHPRAEEPTDALSAIAEQVQHIRAVDVDEWPDDLDKKPRFYVLGLSAPTEARLSVRFFLADPFRDIVKRVMSHYQDLAIEKEFDDQPTYLTVGRLLYETVSKKSSDKEASPLLAGAVFRAVIENTPYPAALYHAILTRIRVDQNEPKGAKKINYVRAAIIKACLLRKYRNQPQHPIQEVLTMALNEQSTRPAYVLGRLFAVLEKAQKDALGITTISDRFFASACATPARVFPPLLRLSKHHNAKAEFGFLNERKIQEIMGLLEVDKNPFPVGISLDEQGIFVLGYYHERNTFYKKKLQETTIEGE